MDGGVKADLTHLRDRKTQRFVRQRPWKTTRQQCSQKTTVPVNLLRAWSSPLVDGERGLYAYRSMRPKMIRSTYVGREVIDATMESSQSTLSETPMAFASLPLALSAFELRFGKARMVAAMTGIVGSMTGGVNMELFRSVSDSAVVKTLSTTISNLSCGWISGLLVSGLLNPWDRALYLSLTNNRHFLDLRNFRNPYHGLPQTIVQRSLSTGLYFPLEDSFLSIFNQRADVKNANLRNVLAGNLAGIATGLILNPLSYVKYQCWGRNNYSFLSQARLLRRNGGLAVFMRGARATCSRDAVFGAVYSLLRNLDFPSSSSAVDQQGLNSTALNDGQRTIGRKNKPFLQDLCSAAIGTILSSPLNYFRNIQYHELSNSTCPTMRQIYKNLLGEVYQENGMINKLKIIQHRFRIGWGTMRVAVGMATASKIYSLCHKDITM